MVESIMVFGYIWQEMKEKGKSQLGIQQTYQPYSMNSI